VIDFRRFCTGEIVADAMIIRQFSLLQPALSRRPHARSVQVRHGRGAAFAALTQYVSELAIGANGGA
jgi:hypothetical protein